jgi:stress response protein YsnF
MDADDRKEIVVPVVSEELHADAVPVVTGGVRVTKRVHTHDELLEQELRKSHVEVKRVATNRVVDGPQPVQRAGNVLIVPVVSEILRVEKQWVVTEEIHITQTEERETVQQTVPVSREEARVERLDESGNPVSTVEPAAETRATPLETPPVAPETSVPARAAPETARTGPEPLLRRSRAAAASSSRGKVRSILKQDPRDPAT